MLKITWPVVCLERCYSKIEAFVHDQLFEINTFDENIVELVFWPFDHDNADFPLSLRSLTKKYITDRSYKYL